MVNLYRIQLNLLVALNVLFEEKNVTRAAERLSLSQSAMSNNLQQLREIFHDELLFREKNTMALTDLAKELQPILYKVLVDIENLIEHTQTVDISNCRRTFNIGMPDKWAALILLKLMPILSKKAPHIKINVVSLSEVSNTDPFLKWNCEFTVARIGVLPDFIERRLLLEDHFVCLLGEHHPLVKRKKISVSEYLSCQHIALRSYSPYLPSDIDQYLLGTEIAQARDIVLYLPHLYTAFCLIEKSDSLITTLSETSVLLCEKKYNCVTRPLDIEIPTIRSYIAWDKKFERDRAHQW